MSPTDRYKNKGKWKERGHDAISEIEIYCPVCKTKMKRVIKWYHWDCVTCKKIFEIRTMPWYPNIMEAEEP